MCNLMLRLRGISASDLSTHCIARIKIKHGSSAHAPIIRIISSSEITERERYENKNFYHALPRDFDSAGIRKFRKRI